MMQERYLIAAYLAYKSNMSSNLNYLMRGALMLPSTVENSNKGLS